VGVRLADAWLNVNRPREAWLILHPGGGFRRRPRVHPHGRRPRPVTDDPPILREVLALIERPDFADAALMLEVADLLVGSNEPKGAASSRALPGAQPGDRKTGLVGPGALLARRRPGLRRGGAPAQDLSRDKALTKPPQLRRGGGQGR
jgi:hypothetical protein